LWRRCTLLYKRKSYNPLLERLPAHQAIAEEEHRASGALLGVNVPNKIIVAVAQQSCRSSSPHVPQTKLQSPGDVAEDSLHKLEILLFWLLEETAQVPNNIRLRQIRSGTDEIPQAINDAPVLSRIRLLCLAIMTHPKPLFHWRCCSPAICHVRHLQDHGELCLLKRNPAVVLAHLNADIDG
jgi:hypothetical protein